MHFLASVDRIAPKDNFFCRACGGADLIAHVKASSQGLTAIAEECEYIYYLCNECRSLNEFSEEGTFYKEAEEIHFANYYVDIAAGLEEMIAPIGSYIKANGSKDGQSFLELGCGFGFVVDYVGKCCGLQSEGIEPSGYGRLGQQLLKVAISDTLLGEGSPHDHKRFDIIFSAEVIEHIPTPEIFAATISRHIKPGGIAIFTTPNAEFIIPESPAAETYSALFPGEHKILFSAQGLQILLKRVGLDHLTVKKPRDSNLIAYAASRSGPIAVAEAAQSDNATILTREYLSTYRNSSKHKIEKISRLGLAMHYRLFKDFVNNGWADQAIILLAEMRPSFRCEVDPRMDFSVSSETDDTSELLHEMLSLCGICLQKETILSQDHHLHYPRGGIAFGKNMGYYITTVIHQIFKPEPAPILNSAINYLNIFIDHCMWLRRGSHPYYHLEAISLTGPAVASLFLFLLKASSPIDERRFTFIEESWFKEEHPVSYSEIQMHLKTYRGRQDALLVKNFPEDISEQTINPIQRILRQLQR